MSICGSSEKNYRNLLLLPHVFKIKTYPSRRNCHVMHHAKEPSHRTQTFPWIVLQLAPCMQQAFFSDPAPCNQGIWKGEWILSSGLLMDVNTLRSLWHNQRSNADHSSEKSSLKNIIRRGWGSQQGWQLLLKFDVFKKLVHLKQANPSSLCFA